MVKNNKYENVIVFLVYAIFLASIVFASIILLNFVIALVSQVYENVMNAKQMNIYIQRQQLNDESDKVFLFFNYHLPMLMSAIFDALPKPL